MKLADKVKQMVMLKTLAKDAQAYFKETERQTSDEFLADGRKTLIVEQPGGDDLKVTRVEAEVLVRDDEALLKRLTKEQRQAVMKEVLDPKLLEDAVARGIISPNVIAECSELEKRKPYMKVTGDLSPAAREVLDGVAAETTEKVSVGIPDRKDTPAKKRSTKKRPAKKTARSKTTHTKGKK